jgi:hypothetical protein
MNTQSFKRVALALGILTFIAVAAMQAQDANPFLGAWKGTLSIGGMELEIGLNFKLDEAKKIQGTMDSITQEAYGLALGNIEIKDKTVTFTISDPNVPGDPSFKGTLDETGKKMAGEFTQAGYAGTFAVEKQ